MHAMFWFENLKGLFHLEDVGVDGEIISEWISNRVRGCGLDSTASG
jgi:hypothetical protein